MRNIQRVSDAYLCSNCGACKAICPKDAISFVKTSVGRLTASVKRDCIDCGLCEDVCPSIDRQGLHLRFEDKYVGHIDSVYVGYSNMDHYFRNAQSGGICATILHYLFEKGHINAALVTIMTEGNTPKVQASIITSVSEIESCQKSCYTPVELLSLLKVAAGYNSLAVVGLPCHIQGLVSLMGKSKRFSNVKYKIGLVCDRTMCETVQDVFKSFVRFQSMKIDWRRKDSIINGLYYPYVSAPVVAYNSSGESVVFPRSWRFALKDMFTPPRCRVCWDKINVFADVVLGDPWRMPDTDEKHGSSLVLTRTGVGEKLITDMIYCGCLNLDKRPIEQALIGQLIEKRREQVAAYSSGMNALHKTIDSYLCESEKECPQSLLDETQHVLKSFFSLELETKEKVVKVGRKVIKNAIWHTRIYNNILWRIGRKLKNIIKNI
ncbi:MAG: Coenzyme F420 hydrogenase/dehydrogenase, beta subunit C-terminal domain [Bacteroidaceae bacterium]|nr:Coenzyme F420 hydrogenase/dehydrogenase, beta subunit C-terminal domain [Bacteroidaceae bacterium]